jgi:hypothetical protein
MVKDFSGLAAAFNMLRMKFNNKPLTYKEVFVELPKIGVSAVIIQKMIERGWISKRRDPENSKCNLYYLENVINKLQFETLFKERRKENNKRNAAKKVEKESSTSDIETLISQLEEQGYRVLAPKFDVEKFKKENPELYKRYLVCE